MLFFLFAGFEPITEDLLAFAEKITYIIININSVRKKR